MQLPHRYSLRAFLLLLALLPAILGVWIRRSIDQSRDVRRLQGLGLNITYDVHEDSSGQLARARVWLASHIGNDFVSVPVAAVADSSASSTVYNEDLTILVRLRWLRRLNLGYQYIDDK